MLKKEKTNLDRQGPKECEEERVGERGRVFVKDSEKERECMQFREGKGVKRRIERDLER